MIGTALISSLQSKLLFKQNINGYGSIITAKRIIMGYWMQLETEKVYVENDFFSPQILESVTTFEDPTISIELNDVSLDKFHLILGKETAEKDNEIYIHFDKSFYVTHFVLNNTLKSKKSKQSKFFLNTYSTYYHDKSLPESGFIRKNREYTFFELAFKKSFLQEIIDNDEPYSDKLFNSFSEEEYENAVKHPLQPSMFQCINEININPFKGALQQLYLETKAAQLLFLQIQEVNRSASVIKKFKSRDIECIHEAKLYVELNYQNPEKIVDLARIVGINQTKLKSGFKELFGTTIFGYVRHLRMEKARQLLLEEKLYVGEVADLVGYKQPQHFAAAFKRKFGVLPSKLKD